MKLPVIAAVLATLAASSGELKPVERKQTLTSSDGVLTVENHDTGKGGTMPELVTTLRWKDDKGVSHAKVIGGKDERLGWVESVGVFSTKSGPTYVLLAEDKLATTSYALVLHAFRRGPGGTTLGEVPDFFPSFEDESRDSALAVEYSRIRGLDVFPRPLEARLDETGGRVLVALFPATPPRKSAAKTNVQSPQFFYLVLEADRLVVSGLDADERTVLTP